MYQDKKETQVLVEDQVKEVRMDLMDVMDHPGSRVPQV